MESMPLERSVQRRGRAVALMALAVAVMASASAAYLHPTQTSPSVTPAAALHLRSIDQTIGGPVVPRSVGLLRDGAISALVQQYGGVHDRPPLGLQGSVNTTNPMAITQLVRQVNVLPVYPRGIFCADGDGSFFEVVLFYADGTTASADVEANGCQAVYVGGWEQPAAWAIRSPALLTTLRSILGRQPGPQQAPLMGLIAIGLTQYGPDRQRALDAQRSFNAL